MTSQHHWSGILTTLFVVLIAVSTFAPALFAAREPITGKDLARVALATQQLEAIDRTLSEVMIKTIRIDELATAMIEGDITRDNAISQQQQLLVQATKELNLVRQKIEGGIALPKLANVELAQSLRDTKSFLIDLAGQCEDFLRDARETFRATYTDSIEELPHVQRSIYKRTVLLLESENKFLELQLQRVPWVGHPQVYLIKTWQATNVALIQINKIALALLDPKHATLAPESRFDLAKASLENALRFIAEAEEKALAQHQRLMASFVKPPAQRTAVTRLGEKVLRTYEHSLEIERQIVRTLGEHVVDFRQHPEAFDASRIDRVFMKLDVLIEQRFVDKERQTELARQMGEALADAPVQIPAER